MFKSNLQHILILLSSFLFIQASSVLAQTCPSPSNMSKSISNNQITTNWNPVHGVLGYKFRIAFDYGPGTVKTGTGTSSVDAIPADTWRIDLSVRSICKPIGYSAGNTTGIFIAQADINENVKLCAHLETLDPNAIHRVIVDNQSVPPMSTQQIIDTYCKILALPKPRIAILPHTEITPNPFKENASINFQLTKTSQVSLQLFNANGQQYEMNLTDQTLESGIYNLPINGSELPTGVYFARLTIDGQSTVYKLIKME